MNDSIHRRDFLRNTASAACAAGLLATAWSGARKSVFAASVPAPAVRKPMELVRIGFVGVGGMGSNHVQNLLKIPGCQITAVCDIVEEKVASAQQKIVDAGFPKPAGYSKGKTDFVRLCETEDLDVVYTATPWEWHVPVCLAALANGKHAISEVPIAYTVEDCWKLVEAVEKTGLHCGMLENCCYDHFELLALNMVKKGLLGRILHGKCGYLHDLREVKWENYGEGLWRREHAIKRNGDLYPTHGLGPIAQCMDINRGNQLDYLVSMGCGSYGLHEYAAELFGADSEQAKEKYKLSDVVTTLIRTKNEQTIVVTHDTNLPRPYSRDILVQGTKGIMQKYPKEVVHIEGMTDGHEWEDSAKYYEQYDHPVWQTLSKQGEGVGHGGMDYIENYRVINAFRKGIEQDIEVYDAVAYSVIGPLSEKSINGGSKPVEIPDFTRGRWKTPRELQVMRPETY